MFSEPVMAVLKSLRIALVLISGSMIAGGLPAVAAPPSLLKIFGKTADSAQKANDPRQLTEVDGPWMILAHSFAGASGRQQAEQLADQLSSDLGVPTFIHEEKFDFSGKVDSPTAEGRVARYANQSRYQAFAVLVGEYGAVDDPRLVKDLKRIKAAKPDVFVKKDEPAATAAEPETPLDAVRNIQKGMLARVGKTSPGPMRNAFATTNPMLPQEYFMSPEVDSFIMELNQPWDHNLLENPGKFTVVVATFSGLSTIADGKRDKEFTPNGDRMVKCAVLADKMTKQLREDGIEAYQFHDRHASMVTIGNFERLGTTGPNGKFEYDPAIRAVMETYRAGDKIELTPKGPGLAAKHVASIPFDVKPTPIAVPRKSKRSIYSGKIGMK
jgi:hypothetical protein